MHILLVEDDLNLGKALSRLLAPHYRVKWVRRVESARSCYHGEGFDLVLLDLGLPDGDGRAWLREIRTSASDTPVLIISARDALDDRVGGLDTGADDYLVKPFEGDELLARIRALLRRRAGSAEPRISAGRLSLDPAGHRFFLGDTLLALTPREHELLALLIHARNRAVSRERLERLLGAGGEGVDSNALEVHIHRLRKLLGHERIETIRGFGYRLVAE